MVKSQLSSAHRSSRRTSAKEKDDSRFSDQLELNLKQISTELSDELRINTHQEDDEVDRFMEILDADGISQINADQNITVIKVQEEQDDENAARCIIHDKNIEGYCMQDKKLLCIDCILSGDHKNHEISNINNGAKHEKDGLTKKFKASQSIKETLVLANNKIVGHTESLKT
jgi:hypothetical protein